MLEPICVLIVIGLVFVLYLKLGDEKEEKPPTIRIIKKPPVIYKVTSIFGDVKVCYSWDEVLAFKRNVLMKRGYKVR